MIKNILKNLGNRQAQVFTELLCFPQGITASELSSYMHSIGFFRSPERNNVHPRLKEMLELGVVQVIGKRQCSITNKTVYVYRVTDDVLKTIREVM